MDALNTIKIYLVGGAVRDRLLNFPVNEHDWVVVGATPEMLLSKGYQQVGRDFPVFIHPVTHEEYALARTERKSGRGYTGFICDFGQHVTLEQDLLRRDLTINAIAMDDEGNLIDPYHGLEDLKLKILRHISPAFREDPLRVLRIARFAARYHHLDFKIDNKTKLLIKEIVTSGEIDYLTAERVWKETEKALSTNNPQIYFQELRECEALERLFINLSFTPSVNQALQHVVQLTNELEARFAVLCAQMRDTTAIEQLCFKLKVPNGYRKIAIIVQKHFHSVHRIRELNSKQILTLLNEIDVWRNPHRIDQLIISSQAYDLIINKKQASYPQGDYLYQAYKIAHQVDIKNIIDSGITGKAIDVELQRLRNEALSTWI